MPRTEPETRTAESVLERLERLAGEATPGPWRATPVMRNGWSGIYRAAPSSVPVFLTNAMADEDAAYIAAADPTTVSALVAAVRAAEREADVIGVLAAHLPDCPCPLHASLARLRTALQALQIAPERDVSG